MRLLKITFLVRHSGKSPFQQEKRLLKVQKRYTNMSELNLSIKIMENFQKNFHVFYLSLTLTRDFVAGLLDVWCFIEKYSESCKKFMIKLFLEKYLTVWCLTGFWIIFFLILPCFSYAGITEKSYLFKRMLEKNRRS